MTDLAQEADRILNTLAFQPFDRCQTLQRNFTNIPVRPGLYAVRHRSIGLLYIGKSKSLRGRFSGGNKAFLWSWLDKYSDEDVRLSLYPLSPWEDPALLLELEARILRATEPPYNVLIPPEI
jgi:GIY-YIG catalytic domain